MPEKLYNFLETLHPANTPVFKMKIVCPVGFLEQVLELSLSFVGEWQPHQDNNENKKKWGSCCQQGLCSLKTFYQCKNLPVFWAISRLSRIGPRFLALSRSLSCLFRFWRWVTTTPSPMMPKKITTAKVTSANESSFVRDLADIPKANSFILSRTFSPWKWGAIGHLKMNYR